MPSRAEVINGCIHALHLGRYLEIGVQTGATFNAVQCPHKVAVDPVFGVDPATLAGIAFAMTSDAYFDAHPEERFDLVFIDGLHTFDQSLRDFTRSLLRLNRGGLILLDDCLPSDYLAAGRSLEFCNQIKEQEQWPDRNWMGDVYKTALFITEFFDQVSLALIADTLGIGAVWFEPRRIQPQFGDRAVQEIDRCEFAKFKYQAARAIPVLPMQEVIARVRR